MRPAVIAGLVLVFLIETRIANGQVAAQQVDRIFSALDKPGSPGCSLGVIHDGQFVYRKSYGEASLELGVPLTSHSVIYVGSISKQFTAASVVLAAEQGFLSLDDDVRKYLPELPDYGHSITLRQMLNQTSGFRDFFDLVYLSGYDVTDFNSPAEILRLIARQKGLNNLPGDEWIYSNTNYFLLGIVVQRATKKTLAQFADENIFHPLGMAHTRFYDDASVVVPGRVAAYDPGRNGSFQVGWSTSYAVVGGGGLMTTVDDLLAWDNNFYANRLGKGTLVKELATPGVLNNGKRTAYGMGLFSANYRGLPTIEHDGALWGYRAELLRFPEQRFTVACLCNVSNADPEDLAHRIADLYLKDAMQPDSSPEQTGNTPLPNAEEFAGRYIEPRSHRLISFTASDGNLKEFDSVLRRRNANQFYDAYGNLVSFEGSGNSVKVTLTINGVEYFSGTRLNPPQVSDAGLRALAGEYRSDELDGALHLSVQRGNLSLQSGKNPPVKLTPIAADEFSAGDSFSLVFRRSTNGTIAGLTLFAPAARGMEFKRIH